MANSMIHNTQSNIKTAIYSFSTKERYVKLNKTKKGIFFYFRVSQACPSPSSLGAKLIMFMSLALYLKN